MSLELQYWNCRGRAQPLVYLMEYLGQNFTFTQLQIFGQWFSQKPALMQNDPLANMPFLKDGDKRIYETKAIGVYVVHKANRADLLGANGQEQVACQLVDGVCDDILKTVVKHISMDLEKFNQNDCAIALKGFFDKLEWLLKNYSFLQTEIRMVDFFLFERMDFLRCFDEDMFNEYPLLMKKHNNIKNLPQIKTYMESAKFQERPFFAGMMSWG